MFITPNALSIIRLCLVPAFIVAYFSGASYSHLIAVGIYVIATFTDFLDGYLARKYNLITNLGKVLDPLGDKMLTMAVLACITIDRVIPFWFLLIILGKEFLMGLGGLVIHRYAKVEIPPANYFGKTATVLFFAVCVTLILLDSFHIEVRHGVSAVMVGAAVLVSLAAFVSYIVGFAKIIRGKKSKEADDQGV